MTQWLALVTDYMWFCYNVTDEIYSSEDTKIPNKKTQTGTVIVISSLDQSIQISIQTVCYTWEWRLKFVSTVRSHVNVFATTHSKHVSKYVEATAVSVEHFKVDLIKHF